MVIVNSKKFGVSELDVKKDVYVNCKVQIYEANEGDDDDDDDDDDASSVAPAA